MAMLDGTMIKIHDNDFGFAHEYQIIHENEKFCKLNKSVLRKS